MKTFSFGGGVQSMACLVLAVQGVIDYDTFIFSNVGDDSENPKTIDYYHTYAKPFAEKNGIRLIELQRIKRDGTPETIMGRMQTSLRSLPIPVRMSNGAPGRRSCTSDFKIAVIAKWQKQNGATKKKKAVCGLGISLDEFHRARTDSGISWQILEYPLIDLRLNRRDCAKIIDDAGLPVPPKSSCFFCPFHSPTEWQRLKREQPELFEKSVELETMLNKRRRELGKDTVFFHSALQPLSIAVGNQGVLWDDMGVCDYGYCFS